MLSDRILVVGWRERENRSRKKTTAIGRHQLAPATTHRIGEKEKKIEVMKNVPQKNRTKMRNSHYTHGKYIEKLILIRANCSSKVSS